MTANTAYNNHSLVGNALKILSAGLAPYVTRKIEESVARGDYAPDESDTLAEMSGDVSVMLRVMTVAWNDVFRDCLGPSERSLVSEIREIRNRWAHLEPFDEDDLDRTLDSVARLLTAVAATSEAQRVNRAKHRLRQKRYGAPAASPSPPADRALASVPERSVADVEPQTPAASPSPPADRAPESVPEPSVADISPSTPVNPEPNLAPLAVLSEDAANHTRVPSSDIDDYIRRGIDFRRQENFPQAMAEFEHVIGIDPGHADAWYHRGLAWGLMGDHQRAIADFTRAITLVPDYADAYNCRGYAHLCLGEYQTAQADLERAIQLNPDDSLTQRNLQQARFCLSQQSERHAATQPPSASAKI